MGDLERLEHMERMVIHLEKRIRDAAIFCGKMELRVKALEERKSRRIPTFEEVLAHLITKLGDEHPEYVVKNVAEVIYDFYDARSWYSGKTQLTKWKLVVTRALKWDTVEEILKSAPAKRKRFDDRGAEEARYQAAVRAARKQIPLDS